MPNFQDKSIKNQITPSIIRKAQAIELRIAKIKKKMPQAVQSKLKKSFLCMEETDLTKKKIELKNLQTVLLQLKQINPLSIRDMKYVHRLLMTGLNDDIGHWRTRQVVVLEGNKIAYVPPQARVVPKKMRQLFHYIQSQKKVSWIIKACLFNYGMQNIHPFFDGNGRIGRIWQHLLLLKASPIFNTILIGDLIKKHERAYYLSLDKGDKASDCGFFIEFCLKIILQELQEKAWA